MSRIGDTLFPCAQLSTVLYVDGACNKNTEGYGWGSVTNDLGEDQLKPEEHPDLLIVNKKCPVGSRNVIIAKATDVQSQQNNYAELLAMVAGIRIGLEKGVKTIYSDSQLIVTYWSLGNVNPKTWKAMDPKKQKYITLCSSLRKAFESKGGKIVKISGDDNLADLGYHK